MVKSITVNGFNTEYAVFGAGERPFVIIPGLSLHSVMPAAAAIEERYADGRENFTFYLIDRRKNAPEDYTVAQIAEDTAAVLTELGIENACVFGASQGGMAAQYIAALHPQLVEKLALGSTLLRTNPIIDAAIGRWVMLAKAGHTDELISDMLDSIYSQKTLEKYRGAMLASIGSVSESELKQFVIMAKAAVGFSAADIISGVKCPATVIGSFGDKVTAPEGALELARALGCGLYLYDSSFGHGVYDEAEDYPKRLFDFFRR